MALHDDLLDAALGTLPLPLRAAFLKHGERRTAEADQPLLRPNSAPGDLFLVFTGGVREYVAGAEGAELTIGFHAAPALLGVDERDPLNNPRAIRYQAMNRAQCMSLAAPHAQRAEADTHVVQFLRTLERARLRRALRSERRLAFEPAHVRCADALVELGTKFGVRTAAGVKIVVPFTMADLARFLNLTPRHLRRFVPAWQKDGVLGRSGEHVEILDMVALKALARPTRSPASSKFG